jgi:hypothetical protein
MLHPSKGVLRCHTATYRAHPFLVDLDRPIPLPMKESKRAGNNPKQRPNAPTRTATSDHHNVCAPRPDSGRPATLGAVPKKTHGVGYSTHLTVLSPAALGWVGR